MAQDMLEYLGWLALTVLTGAVLVGLYYAFRWLLQQGQRGRLARCPVCAEWIQPMALKCRFCGTVLRPQPVQRVQPAQPAQAAQPAPQAPAMPPLQPAPAVQPAQPAQAAQPAPQAPAMPPPQPAPAAPPSQPAPATPPDGRIPAAPVVPALLTPVPQPAAEPAGQPLPVPGAAPAKMPEPAPAQITVAEPPPPPVESETATRIASMRHAPAEQHPPGFYEKVLDWLHDEDPRVREESVRFLARHWRDRDDAAHLLEMVLRDTEAEVRLAAAECLGGVFRATRNREVDEQLAGVARNAEEEARVRAAAYAAIRRINGY
jgi:hypothetical protein